MNAPQAIDRRQSPRSDSDIKSRLHNWGRWIRWCERPPNGGYICPLGRISESKRPKNEDGSETAYEPPFEVEDAAEINAAVLKLSPQEQIVVRAHYVQPGASSDKAYRMRLSLAWYFRVLQQSRRQIEYALAQGLTE